jgi:hypothetical protein
LLITVPEARQNPQPPGCAFLRLSQLASDSAHGALRCRTPLRLATVEIDMRVVNNAYEVDINNPAVELAASGDKSWNAALAQSA